MFKIFELFFSFCCVNRMLVIRDRTHKTLVRIGMREDPDQTALFVKAFMAGN